MFQYGNYSSEAEDLRAVIEYFTGVNRSTVAVLGHSKGGNVVLLYASKYHDISAVVNVSGCFDLKRGIKERLGENFLEKLKKDGYIDVQTRTDEIIPVEDALEFAKIIPNHKLEIVEGADHRYSSHQDELASIVLPFIKECLQYVDDLSK
ncbi:hypothetical protein BUALT_Bualt09G0033600 [Buddleja alternifolia]|uniref:BAAT/Acyl-CoA thioester hydrolase C-terminal domain-containing protein n=1 Tax=Buddleja alternifolia TaxID=168488 RepID=A0AAV6X0U1_9LAMI|nr:hypothetical protein BUALT_Bualt09G0033600 [Buddleja alternifolia]